LCRFVPLWRGRARQPLWPRRSPRDLGAGRWCTPCSLALIPDVGNLGEGTRLRNGHQLTLCLVPLAVDHAASSLVLRLDTWAKLPQGFMCNALPIGCLATGASAVVRVGPRWCEGASAALTSRACPTRCSPRPCGRLLTCLAAVPHVGSDRIELRPALPTDHSPAAGRVAPAALPPPC